ncbi:MAG: glycosyltransferase [Bryobacteraceae bacterium]
MDESQQQPQATTPKVSAVIFSNNHAAALRRCIEALEKSIPREPLEILVVDAGSYDESPTLDAQFADAKFLRLERNFGATKALNIGTRTALGDFIFFLDAEVEVEPTTVALLVAHLEADSDVAAVCPMLLDEKGAPVSQIRKLPDAAAFRAFMHGAPPPPLPIDPSKEFIDVDYASRAAIMVRKSFLRNMNYLDERYGHHWSDADLCAQIRRAGKRIRLFPGLKVRIGERPAVHSQLRPSMAADMGVGAAEFLGKYRGFGAGLGFRTAMIFWALGQLLTFQQPGYAFGRLAGLISGQKIDGSQ